MKHSVVEMRRPERQRLKKIVQRGRERDHARHAEAMLALWEPGGNVSETARRCHASRNSVRLWEARFEAHGEAGLVPRSRGREAWKASAQALEKLADLVRNEPLQHGDVRSRWSSELLAVELARGGVVEVHATTVRRWLSRLQIVYRRVLARASADEEVFYVDEADIDLNPRISHNRFQAITQPPFATIRD